MEWKKRSHNRMITWNLLRMQSCTAYLKDKKQKKVKVVKPQKVFHSDSNHSLEHYPPKKEDAQESNLAPFL